MKVVYKGWGVKKNYIQIAKHWTTKKNSKQNMPKFNEHPKLKDEMLFLAKNEVNWPIVINRYCVATLALGSQPRQGVARLRAKRETWESLHMLPGVQRV